MSAAAFAKPILTGDTNHPEESIYFPGEKVELVFHISGLEPEKDGPDLKVRVVDEYERQLAKYTLKTMGDNRGCDMCFVRDAPSNGMGFYRVYAELADGTKLYSPWSTRRDGEMTYAIVRDPKTREVNDDSILLFYSSNDPRLRGYSPEQPRGMGQWRHLEPNYPGEYSKNPDNAKIKVGAPIFLYNAWCSTWSDADKRKYYKMENHQGGAPALTAEGEKVFSDYCRAYAKNYRRQCEECGGYKPRLYEVSSEWMHTDNGSRTVEDVLRVYEIAEKAVHAEDPEGIVCGIGYDPYFWITHDYLKAGIGRHIDALTVHPYYNPDPVEPNGLVNKIRTANEWMKQYAGRVLPVYNTECGYSTRQMPTLEPVQMKHVTRMSLIFAGEGWKSISLFMHLDYRGEPGFGYRYNLALAPGNHRQALGDFQHWKSSPKPIYPAVSAMTWFLCNSKSCGDIPFLGKTVWGYVFKHITDGKINLALWDWSGEKNKLKLKVGRKEIRLADHMGNERTAKCDTNGEVALELYDMPTYVFDVDPAIWENADGERKQLAEKFKAEQEAARRAKGIEVKSIAPSAAADGTPAVEVVLVDVSGKANAGELSVCVKGVPGSERKVAYALKGDETKTFRVEFGAIAVRPLALEEVEATAKIADGRSAAKTDRTNFLAAHRDDAMEIDGAFAKWAKIPHFALDPATSCQSGQIYYGGEKDQTASVAIVWNAKGVYFHFDVTDDHFVASKPGIFCWQGDAVQVALAKTYRYEQTSNSYLDMLMQSHTEQTFALTDSGEDAYRHTTFELETSNAGPVRRGPIKLGADDCDFRGKKERLADGSWRWQSEIFLPWRILSLGAPKPGTRIGFSFSVNDIDGATKPANHSTQLGAFPLKYPDKFGAMTLVK